MKSAEKIEINQGKNAHAYAVMSFETEQKCFKIYDFTSSFKYVLTS